MTTAAGRHEPGQHRAGRFRIPHAGTDPAVTGTVYGPRHKLVAFLIRERYGPVNRYGPITHNR